MEKEREHAHDKKEAKEFLLGLKADLENDRKEMNEDIWGYETSAKWLSYFVYEKNINKDSLKAHSWVLVSKTHLLANKGRYEGLDQFELMIIAKPEQLSSIVPRWGWDLVERAESGLKP